MKGKKSQGGKESGEGFPEDLKASIERRKAWLKREPDLLATGEILDYDPKKFDSLEFATLQNLSRDEWKDWRQLQDRQPMIKIKELAAKDYPEDYFNEFLEYVNGMICDELYLNPKWPPIKNAKIFEVAEVRNCLLSRAWWNNGGDPDNKPSPDEISEEQIKDFINGCEVQEHRARSFINQAPVIIYRRWFEGLAFHEALKNLRMNNIPNDYIFFTLYKNWKGDIPSRNTNKSGAKVNIAYWIKNPEALSDEALYKFTAKALRAAGKKPPIFV